MTTRRKPIPNAATLPAEYCQTPSTRTVSPTKSHTTSEESRTWPPDGRIQQSGDGDGYNDLLDSYYATSDDERQLSPAHISAPAAATIDTSQYTQAEISPHVKGLFTPAVLPDDDSAANPISTLSIDEADEVDTNDPSATSRTRSKIATALEDTSIFLGGLIKHPVESNRHFSILRHSHGLVYFQGPNTNVAFSIFANSSIPADRRIWLQLKGWTGHTGMATKALVRANANWINVTPDHEVNAEQLPPLDERAWQRDMNKFRSKANKTQQKHILRETVVVRIPYEASDGYFRVVLTAADSRRVLCPSPVFRVASTSASASSLKGASLRTLPLELGVKVAQTMATTVATNTLAPLVTQVRDQVVSALPASAYTSHVQTAWDAAGAQDKIDTVNEQYAARQNSVASGSLLERTMSAPVTYRSMATGDSRGPQLPFPIRISCEISKGTGASTTNLGTPTANLDALPPDLLAPLPVGVYFGWAYVSTTDKKQLHLHQEWRHTVVTITYSSDSKAARRKAIRAYLIHDFPATHSFVGSKLKLVIMGHLRPLISPKEQELLLLETVNDIAITQASLSRPEWGHEETLQRIKSGQSARSVTEKMIDLRVAGQRQIDRVPVHLLGVRSDSFGMHDRGMHGNGGLWVKRD